MTAHVFPKPALGWRTLLISLVQLSPGWGLEEVGKEGMGGQGLGVGGGAERKWRATPCEGKKIEEIGDI